MGDKARVTCSVGVDDQDYYFDREGARISRKTAKRTPVRRRRSCNPSYRRLRRDGLICPGESPKRSDRKKTILCSQGIDDRNYYYTRKGDRIPDWVADDFGNKVRSPCIPSRRRLRRDGVSCPGKKKRSSPSSKRSSRSSKRTPSPKKTSSRSSPKKRSSPSPKRRSSPKKRSSSRSAKRRLSSPPLQRESSPMRTQPRLERDVERTEIPVQLKRIPPRGVSPSPRFEAGIGEREDRLSQVQQELERARVELEQLRRKQRETEEKEVDPSLQDQVLELQRIRAEREDELERLRSQYEAERARLLEEGEGEVADLRQQLAHLQRELEKQRREYLAELHRLQSHGTLLREKFEEARDKFNRTREKVRELKRELRKERARTSPDETVALRRTLEEAQAEKDELRTELDSVRQMYQENERDLLKAQAQQRDRLRGLEIELENCREQARQGEIAFHEQEEALKAQIQQLEIEGSKQRVRIADLKKREARALDEAQTASVNVKMSASKVNTLEARVRELEEKAFLSEIERDRINQERRAKIKELRRRINELEKEKIEREGELPSLVEERDRLREQLTRAEEELVSIRARNLLQEDRPIVERIRELLGRLQALPDSREKMEMMQELRPERGVIVEHDDRELELETLRSQLLELQDRHERDRTTWEAQLRNLEESLRQELAACRTQAEELLGTQARLEDQLRQCENRVATHIASARLLYQDWLGLKRDLQEVKADQERRQTERETKVSACQEKVEALEREKIQLVAQLSAIPEREDLRRRLETCQTELTEATARLRRAEERQQTEEEKVRSTNQRLAERETELLQQLNVANELHQRCQDQNREFSQREESLRRELTRKETEYQELLREGEQRLRRREEDLSLQAAQGKIGLREIVRALEECRQERTQLETEIATLRRTVQAGGEIRGRLGQLESEKQMRESLVQTLKREKELGIEGINQFQEELKECHRLRRELEEKSQARIRTLETDLQEVRTIQEKCSHSLKDRTRIYQECQNQLHQLKEEQEARFQRLQTEIAEERATTQQEISRLSQENTECQERLTILRQEGKVNAELELQKRDLEERLAQHSAEMAQCQTTIAELHRREAESLKTYEEEMLECRARVDRLQESLDRCQTENQQAKTEFARKLEENEDLFDQRMAVKEQEWLTTHAGINKAYQDRDREQQAEIDRLRAEIEELQASLQEAPAKAIAGEYPAERCRDLRDQLSQIRENLQAKKDQIRFLLRKSKQVSQALSTRYQQVFHENLEETKKEIDVRRLFGPSGETKLLEMQEAIARFLELTDEFYTVDREVKNLSDDVPADCQKIVEISRTILAKTEEIDGVLRQIANHSEDLAGTVRVYLRFRECSQSCISVEADARRVKKILCGSKSAGPFGDFFNVYYQKESNAEIFAGRSESKIDWINPLQMALSSSPVKAIRRGVFPLFQQLQDGYHLVLFGYGYSGAGKTFTLVGSQLGTPSQIPGLIYYGLANLEGVTRVKLHSLYELKPHNVTEKNGQLLFDGQVRIFQATPALRKRLDDKRFPGGKEAKGFGLSQGSWTEMDQTILGLSQLLEAVTSYRTRNGTIRATPNNPESSRSHLFLTLEITFSHGKTGYLTLIDMAGRESPFDIFAQLFDVESFLREHVHIWKQRSVFDENGSYKSEALSTAIYQLMSMSRAQLEEQDQFVHTGLRTIGTDQPFQIDALGALQLIKEGFFTNETINHLQWFFQRKTGRIPTQFGRLGQLAKYHPNKVLYPPSGEVNRPLSGNERSKVVMIPLLQYLDQEIQPEGTRPTKFVMFCLARQELEFCSEVITTLQFAQEIKST